MCIIAISKKNIPMPSLNTVRNMWYSNPDGAGIMYTKDGVVNIHKGFMHLGDLEDRLDLLNKEIDTTKEAVVLHFRIGTAGGNTAANTHPFPITDNIQMLQKLKHKKLKLGVAHNGIIDVTPRQKDISDTMEYIAGQLAPLYRAVPDFYKNKDLMLMVKNAITSKMAFLTGSGSVYTIGEFNTDKESGMVYSNYSWQGVSRYRRNAYWNTDWDDYSSYWNIPPYTSKKSDTKAEMPSAFYSSRMLMPLIGTENIVERDQGMLWEAYLYDFAISAEGKLWVYDEETMNYLPIYENVTVYNADGSTLKFNYNQSFANPVDEDTEISMFDLIEEGISLNEYLNNGEKEEEEE